MPKKIVSIPFKAVRPGDVYPSVIEAGEEVDGRLAEIGAELKALKAAPKKKPAGNGGGGQSGGGQGGGQSGGGEGSSSDPGSTGG